jgi:histidyl-tRNA synthetase
MNGKQPLSTEPYKGVRDFYPADWARLQSVFDTVRAKLRAYGFEEYNASPMERAELYESKTSEEIVNEQTYTFTDRGDRRVTLRPEMTPTLARMVAARRRELAFPLRWFSIGNRFRYERPQKGRLREFFQCDVDIVGLAGTAAEGEIIVMAHEILKAFGASDKDFVIHANSRALLNAACEACGLSKEDALEYLGLVDRKNKMPVEKFESERARFRRAGRDPLELIESRSHRDVDRIHQDFLKFIEAFTERGITNVVFDPTIVRGFLYYTGLVFEVFDTNPENPRALMGGGRYDGLVSLFGGDSLPAVGFAFGDVTLMDFLETHSLLPASLAGAEVYLGTPSLADIAGAQRYAEELRAQGIAVMVNVTDRGLGDQIKEAVKRGIPYFIAYGPTEAKSGQVKLKDLAASSEEACSHNEVAELIHAARTGA